MNSVLQCLQVLDHCHPLFRAQRVAEAVARVVLTGLRRVVDPAALVGWRLAYYGHPLPNTYYAKVSGPVLERVGYGAGLLSYLVMTSGLGAYVVLIVADWIATAVRVVKSRSLDEVGFETLFSLGWLGYWVYVGGDHFQERFLIALGPVGIFLFLKLLRPVRAHAAMM